ncbi:MAG: hypothetical protein CMK59_03615 [Proteobacteria bacterium]|nr:hypothetical protein [Pseudomonadota bacterium]
MNRPSGQSFQRSDLFGGTGTVTIWNILNTVQQPFSAALWCELEAGGFVGPHLQQRDPEMVICLSGEGTATVNKIPHELRAGTLVGLPLGAVLSIRNDGAEPLTYLIIKAKVDS